MVIKLDNNNLPNVKTAQVNRKSGHKLKLTNRDTVYDGQILCMIVISKHRAVGISLKSVNLKALLYSPLFLFTPFLTVFHKLLFALFLFKLTIPAPVIVVLN